jgi:hypothetical protein
MPGKVGVHVEFEAALTGIPDFGQDSPLIYNGGVASSENRASAGLDPWDFPAEPGLFSRRELKV